MARQVQAVNVVRQLSLIAGLIAAAMPFSAGAKSTPLEAAAKWPTLECDTSLTTHFNPNAATKVLLIRAFKKGERLPNPSRVQAPFDPTSQILPADVCMVKLLVGPGHPGPAGAPSTSAGIGIEIWLPAKSVWNGRVHAVGGAGFVGSEESDVGKVSSLTGSADMRSAPFVAAQEGAVTSSTDTGHVGHDVEGWGRGVDGSFGMTPDGAINTILLRDFASRAIHEQVVLTKALAKAYYGVAARYSYWDGSSNGGRQALMQAQRYPQDFDGIIAGSPAINWTMFAAGSLYPHVVIERDLGGTLLSTDQVNLVSNAAIAACDGVGGKHLGFILQPETCRYDPVKDAAVLCVIEGGNNNTQSCVTRRQATVFNKVWYGLTTDGSVPDPAIDNGSGPLGGRRKWYGLPRGTSLVQLASAPLPILTASVALSLQDSTVASLAFHNAKANGADGWKTLSYAQLAQAFDAGIAGQPQLGYVNANDPDLSALKARGVKLIQLHGMNDNLIAYRGSVDYYEQVLARFGGAAEVRKFYRLYTIPGMAHVAANGTSNPDADPPLPRALKGEVYKMLTDWVEKGAAPDDVVLRSGSAILPVKSLPLCAYPDIPVYVGGDMDNAAAYVCRKEPGGTIGGNAQ